MSQCCIGALSLCVCVFSVSGSKSTNLGVWQDADTDADYVVLDKSRGRATARQDKHYNNKNNKPSLNTSKGNAVV